MFACPLGTGTYQRDLPTSLACCSEGACEPQCQLHGNPERAHGRIAVRGWRWSKPGGASWSRSGRPGCAIRWPKRGIVDNMQGTSASQVLDCCYSRAHACKSAHRGCTVAAAAYVPVPDIQFCGGWTSVLCDVSCSSSSTDALTSSPCRCSVSCKSSCWPDNYGWKPPSCLTAI